MDRETYTYVLRMQGSYTQSFRINPGKKPINMPLAFWTLILSHEEILVDSLAQMIREKARQDYVYDVLEGVKTTILKCITQNLCESPLKPVGGGDGLLNNSSRQENRENTPAPTVRKCIVEGQEYYADENNQPESSLLHVEF